MFEVKGSDVRRKIDSGESNERGLAPSWMGNDSQDGIKYTEGEGPY